jgi:gas vesicle protein
MEEEKTLETLLEQEAETEEPCQEELKQLSRRRFLTGAVVGGATGLAVAAGTGVTVWKVSDAELQAAKEAADAELAACKAAGDADLQAAKEAAGFELDEVLKAAAEDLDSALEAAAEELAGVLGLLDLYEDLEKVGLDSILESGLAAMALPLKAVEAGANALKNGLDWAEGGLQSMAEALPTAQESLLWLEAQVSAVAGGLEKLQASVAKALDRATDNAIGRAVEDFANMVLETLPFGLGDRFRDTLQGLAALVTSVDELVEGINAVLLEPLREQWFSEEEGKGVGGSFVDPLIENVLNPVEAHLVSLADLADNWQEKLVSPSQAALAERAQIREQIARYKDDHGLA